MADITIHRVTDIKVKLTDWVPLHRAPYQELTLVLTVANYRDEEHEENVHIFLDEDCGGLDLTPELHKMVETHPGVTERVE